MPSFAYTCVRWVCTVRREIKSRAAISLLASPSATSRTTSRSVGVRDAQPLDGRLRSPRPAARRRSLRRATGRLLPPMPVKAVLAHGVAKRRDGMFVVGVVDLEPNGADLRRISFAAPKSRAASRWPRVPSAASRPRHSRMSGTAECALCPAAQPSALWASRSARSGSLWQSRCVPRRQCPGLVPPGRRCDLLVGPASGRDQIAARQGNFGNGVGIGSGELALHTQPLPGRLARLDRRRNIARGHRCRGQYRKAESFVVRPQIGGGCQGGVGRGSGRAGFTAECKRYTEASRLPHLNTRRVLRLHRR